jgi:uncharacterized membrane protein required for colicin V production
MIDLIIALILFGLAVRGWRRGLVRAVFDLVGLVLGTFLAFRLSGPVGDFLTDRFGVTSEWSRIGAGVVLFAAVGFGLSFVARALSGIMELPGLAFVNRIGGAGLAAAWGAVLLTILIMFAGLLPIGAFRTALEESRLAIVVAGPNSIAGRLVRKVAGEPVAMVIRALEELAGERRVVVDGDERVDLEPVAEDGIGVDKGAAGEMLEFINAARLEAGADPLPWSDELAALATDHALEMYRQGYLSGLSPVTGRVSDRARMAGVRLESLGENIGLAATTRAVHEEMVSSAPHRGRMISRGFDRVGVGVVAGPYGLIVVEVFGG